MGGIRLPFPACLIAEKGCIDRHDLRLLRSCTFVDGIQTYDAARLLVALNGQCPDRCPDWPGFFVESLSTFIVHTTAPYGEIDALKSAWLIRTISVDGIIDDPMHLELLVHAMERASTYPEPLSLLALDQLRHAFADTPAGAHHARRPRHAGITEFDLAFIWQVLRPCVQNGKLLLTAAEAAVLQLVDRRVTRSGNHPGWNEVMQHEIVQRPATSLRPMPWMMITETPTGSVNYAA